MVLRHVANEGNNEHRQILGLLGLVRQRRTEMIEMYDIVRLKGDTKFMTVVGYHQGVDKFQVQFGNDASTQTWIARDLLELVEKAKQADSEASFYPPKSIME
jgi:hypothetical protein